MQSDDRWKSEIYLRRFNALALICRHKSAESESPEGVIIAS